MDTLMERVATPGRRARRRQAVAFKAQVVAACLEPGVSVAAVALANGLNANLLRQWVKAHRQAALTRRPGEGADGALAPALPTLVPVRVQHAAVTGSEDIRVTLRRGQTLIEVSWPVSAAEAFGHWLSGELR
jgi:transposase-like protein